MSATITGAVAVAGAGLALAITSGRMVGAASLAGSSIVPTARLCNILQSDWRERCSRGRVRVRTLEGEGCGCG